MTFFDYLQLLGGFVLALGYIPQIIQIITTHSCRDMNLRTYLAMVLGIGLMEVYAINLVLNESGLMFLITNSVSLLLVIFICLLIIAMRKVKTGAEEKEALYVSKWDDGSVIVTPCKVNSRTKRIYNIQSCPYSPNGCLEEESIIIGDEEYPVQHEDVRKDDYHIA